MKLPESVLIFVLFAVFCCPSLSAQEKGNAPAPPPKKAAPPLEELVARAESATKSGNWQAAVDLYGRWTDRDPLNPLARASYGSSLYRTGQFIQARRELEKAVLMEPKLATTWATLGLIYDRANEPWLELSAFTRAVHLEPREARHRVLLAMALAGQGWKDAAEQQLNKALELNPDSADAHFNLAVLSIKRVPPAYETARRHYKRARALGGDPDGEIESILWDHDKEKKNK